MSGRMIEKEHRKVVALAVSPNFGEDYWVGRDASD